MVNMETVAEANMSSMADIFDSIKTLYSGNKHTHTDANQILAIHSVSSKGECILMDIRYDEEDESLFVEWRLIMRLYLHTPFVERLLGEIARELNQYQIEVQSEGKGELIFRVVIDEAGITNYEADDEDLEAVEALLDIFDRYTTALLSIRVALHTCGRAEGLPLNHRRVIGALLPFISPYSPFETLQ
jgi:hypothetical protein